MELVEPEIVTLNEDRPIPLVLKRDSSLDFLRGIMLIVMTIDHNGGILKAIFYQKIGFVSAAEGFVYLSGVVFGLVYTKKIHLGFDKLFKMAQKRALIIYSYHLLIVILLTSPLWMNLISKESMSNSIFFSPFIEDPIRSGIFYTIFLLQPHLLDILPIYCIFILFAVPVLKSFYQDKIKAFFLFSGGLWLLSQFIFFDSEYPEQGIKLGSFNIFAWQFLFFTGLYIGFLRSSKQILYPVSKRNVLLAVTIASILFLINILTFTKILTIPNLLISKHNLGILRLINFFAIAYCIDYLIKTNKFVYSRWIAFIGQHSLQVFVFHIFFFYFLDIIEKKIGIASQLMDISFTILAVGSLIIPALLHKYAVENYPLIRKMGI